MLHLGARTDARQVQLQLPHRGKRSYCGPGVTPTSSKANVYACMGGTWPGLLSHSGVHLGATSVALMLVQLQLPHTNTATARARLQAATPAQEAPGQDN